MSLSPRDEQSLLQRCQSGDREAFAALYHAYKQSILHFAWTLLRDADAAQDVCQETFQYVFRKLPDYEEQGKFRFLIFRAARSLCMTELKKRKRLNAGPVEDLPLPVDEAAPEAALALAEMQGQVAEAMQSLPPLHREVLVLRFVRDFSYAEIADLAGVSIGTVKSRIHNGLQKLEKALRGGAGVLDPEALAGDS